MKRVYKFPKNTLFSRILNESYLAWLSSQFDVSKIIPILKRVFLKGSWRNDQLYQTYLSTEKYNFSALESINYTFQFCYFWWRKVVRFIFRDWIRIENEIFWWKTFKKRLWTTIYKKLINFYENSYDFIGEIWQFFF